MIRSITLVILSIFLISSDFQENEPGIRFRRLTINDGLSLSSVYCIYQDSKGFIWLGTEDGLNRYDGKNFRIFRPDPRDTNSISYRWIEHIYEDGLGILWFGSRGGLTRFDPKCEKFTQYRYNGDDKYGLSNDTITSIIHDPHQKYLWIGTLKGLNRIDMNTTELVLVENFKGDRTILSSRINFIIPDEKNNMWIGTNDGLFFYDFDTEEFTLFSPDESTLKDKKIVSLIFDDDHLWIGTDQELFNYSSSEDRVTPYPVTEKGKPGNPINPVQNLYLDSCHNLWILSESGLYKLNRETKEILSVIDAVDITHSLSVNTGKPILEDIEGFLWYGTFGSGLFRINPTTGDIYRYINSPADHTSLSENSINCIFEDHSGVIWFGTFGAGVCIYYPQSHRFELIRHDPLDQNSVSSNFIWSVIEDKDGNVWIGTNNRGLNKYSPQTGEFSFYDHLPNDPASISHSSVREIFQDNEGTIWVGTDGGGLNYLNQETGKFTYFQNDPNDMNSLSNNSVRVIMEDRNGDLWVGTRGGLNKYDRNTQTFERFLHSDDDSTSLSSNFIYSSIYEDKEGFLWIGTYGGGLNKMDPSEGTFQSYLTDPKDPLTISDNVVFSIYEDTTGIFWIGTNDGLNRFDPDREEFTRFGKNEGLPNEVIYGILPDQNNNIWLSTNFGISRFNLTDYGTKNFDMNDGLQSNEFNGGAYHKGESGTLYFAGVYGLNIINPVKILPVKNTSQLVITKLAVLGREVNVLIPEKLTHTVTQNLVFQDEAGNFFSPYNISYAEEIVLQYRYRFFSIEFVALNNPLPENLNYAYRMDDIEDEWIYSGERSYVSYANMNPGTYYFSVKSENPDGVWSDSETRLKIIITPPFWKTWWFIALEIITALAFFVYLYSLLLKSRTNKILKIQNKNIQIANQKLAESEKNLMNLNATKDKFFSIISHDLKNPFSSLLSITELLVQNYSSSDEAEKISGIQKIQESVKQIYNLLENLLTWSRSQSGRIQFEPAQFNLSNVLQENYNLHKIPAEKKGVHLSATIPENILVFGDREMINTVVRNLVGNAVKFTGKDKRVEISMKEEDHTIIVMVNDQGVGISEEDLNKLFRIDLKFKSRGTSGEKGTGLGLILCKEFVEKNGGKMIVKSFLGEGSEFGFTIPKPEQNQ